MKRRRSRNPEASRERILQAAADLFSQRGYTGTGVDQLAERSGIAKTAIYYHYGSKEGLLAAVLERIAVEWIEGVRQFAHETGDPTERLDRALAGMRALLEEKPWVVKLLQLLALEVAEHKPDIRATLQTVMRRARTAIVEGLEDALGMELPRAELAAGILLAILGGVSVGRHVDPELAPLDDVFAEFRRIAVFLIVSRLNPETAAAFEEGLTPAKIGNMTGPVGETGR